VIAFLVGGDVPVAIVFILLTLIYVSEVIGRFGHSPMFLKLQGVFQLINGVWLMYLTLAFALNFADGMKLWV
jgi:succinate-acetate transporter protein